MVQTAAPSVSPARFIDPAGAAVRPLPAFARDPAELIRLYRAMVLTRAFDAKAVALQRTGRLGTFASSLGQEAVAVGAAAAMRPEDVFVPSFREQGGQLWRGVTAIELLTYWGGDERGSDFKVPREDFPGAIPVASHAPHAVGAALAFKLRGEPRAAVCILGDGATSKGDFAEALNIAGVWKVPAVFVINNNGCAISVPVERQTAAETLAHKAVAAGIAGERADGNDVVAVRDAVDRALARARAGGGSGLIEAVTYRLGDHTTADDASRYRDDALVSARWREEPIRRLREYLTGIGQWSREKEEALLATVGEQIEAAATAYLAMPPRSPETMFDHAFARLPGDLAAQRAAESAEGQ